MGAGKLIALPLSTPPETGFINGGFGAGGASVSSATTDPLLEPASAFAILNSEGLIVIDRSTAAARGGSVPIDFVLCCLVTGLLGVPLEACGGLDSSEATGCGFVSVAPVLLGVVAEPMMPLDDGEAD